jgi:hypothetical protein
VDTSYHQSIRQAHKIKPFYIEQEHPHISLMVGVMRNCYLLRQHEFFVDSSGEA